MTFINRCMRVLHIAKKPTRKELNEIIKVKKERDKYKYDLARRLVEINKLKGALQDSDRCNMEQALEMDNMRVYNIELRNLAKIYSQSLGWKHDPDKRRLKKAFEVED